MKKRIDVLFIDPPMKQYDDSTFLYGNLYQPNSENNKVFNPGILSIASYLLSKNYSVKVIHCLSEEKIYDKLVYASGLYMPKVVAISCSYMHTYLTTKDIAFLVKKLFGEVYLVIGGGHAGDIPGIVLKEMPADIVIQGEGEYAFEKLLEVFYGDRKLDTVGNIYFNSELAKTLDILKSSNIERFQISDFEGPHCLIKWTEESLFRTKNKEELMPLDDMPFIRYDLYENYLEYPPYIEESRGCYGNCEFCVSAQCKTYRYKSYSRFLEELDYVIGIFGKENVIPFMASNFGVNVENTVKLLEGIINKYGKLKWLSEFRIDVKWEKYIDLMHESGCVSYGIGLESASPQILEIMKKTTHTEEYLARSEKLIEKIISFGDSYVHLNFMFYIGETPKSMADNMGYIYRHFKDISIVHYSPVILYANTAAWELFENYVKLYGASIVYEEPYKSMHAYPVNVSELYSYMDGCFFSRIIEKMFVKTEGYMVNHETRVARGSKGEISEKAKEEYIERMLKN